MWAKLVPRVGVALGASLSAIYIIDRKNRYAYGAEKLYDGIIPQPSPDAKWDFDWDHRSSKTLEQKDGKQVKKLVSSKAIRNLILVRHGQYHHTDVAETKVLTSLGREQADFTGERLKQLGHSYDILTNSTMETADVIANRLPKTLSRKSDVTLEEGDPCPPEPLTYHLSEEEFRKDGARIEAAFRKYFHRAPSTQEHDSYEVIVCHGNVIRYFLCRALQFPPEAWLRFQVAHGSISWIEIMPDGSVSLRHIGDIGHIPAEKVTYN